MNKSFSKLLLNRFDRFVRVLNLSKTCVSRIALDMQVLLHSWFMVLCRYPPIIPHFHPIFVRIIRLYLFLGKKEI